MDISTWRVSAAHLEWIPTLCRRHDIRVEKLLGEVGLDTHFSFDEDLLWPTFTDIVSASGRYFSLASLRQAGATFWEHSATQVTQQNARHGLNIQDQCLMHWGPKGRVSAAFPLRSEVLEQSSGYLSIKMTSLDESQACHPLFHFIAGQIESLASLSGKHPTLVDVQETETGAVFDIRYTVTDHDDPNSRPGTATQGSDVTRQYLMLQEDHERLLRDQIQIRAQLATLESQLTENTKQFENLGLLIPGLTWLTVSSQHQENTLHHQRIQWASPATLALLGYEKSEILQLNPTTLVSANDVSMVQRMSEHSEPPGFRIILLHKSGDEKAVNLKSLGFDNLNGDRLTWWFAELLDTQSGANDTFNHQAQSFRAITDHRHQGESRTSFIARDISHQSAQASQREALEHQLRMAQKTTAVGQLSSGIVHDFNNLLVATMGYADLAIEQDNPKLRTQYLTEIRATAQRGQELTQQILAFSHQKPANKKIIAADTLISNIHNLILRLLPADIDIQISAQTQLGIKGDPAQLEQVLINLAINAGHAMPEGGTLSIELEEENTATLLLSMSDTGCGMDAATRERVFEPFFTTKPEGSGTGLGLSVVHDIITQHEGTISVTSTPDHGTRFDIRLPIETGKAPKAADRRQHTPAQTFGGDETILVVEDNEPVLELTRLMLTAAGYTVVGAIDAEQALALVTAQPQRIDLALVDVVLPTTNGYLLSEQMLQLAPDLSIILTTGYPADSPILEAVRNSDKPLLAKPFGTQQLRSVIRTTLDAKKTANNTAVSGNSNLL